MIMPSESVASTLRTRSSLLFRLLNWEDERSWEEFYRLYRKLVYGFARKSGLSHEEAEEVTNDVFVRVAKTIDKFESNPNKGSFRGWLMNLTRWRVNDKFRSRPQDAGGRRRPKDELQTSTIERLPDRNQDAELWDREWKASLLDAAMCRVAKRAKAKHYQVFELYTRQQWPVVRISRELGVNPAAVYLINHRLGKQLKTEIIQIRDQLR
jgi:RNA polymerase sigma factor (sigma-70 family)